MINNNIELIIKTYDKLIVLIKTEHSYFLKTCNPLNEHDQKRSKNFEEQTKTLDAFC